MAGLVVTRDVLDQRAAEALLQVRSAFNLSDTIAAFLADNPVDASGVDPLTLPTKSEDPSVTLGRFGYTADEAYLIRNVFEQLQAMNVKPILRQGRRLTGLS